MFSSPSTITSSRRILFALGMLLLAVPGAHAQIDPTSPADIKWSRIAGAGAPTAPCPTSTVLVGQPYLDSTNNKNYTCGPSGWFTAPSSSGAGLPQCSDTSGSGTVQSCATSPTFTPVANQSCILYNTTTANTGTGLTVNVNSLGAKSVAKWLSTTTLAAGDVPAGKPVVLCYDGTSWNLSTIGNAPAAGSIVASINGAGGAFTFTGPGVSCTTTTCTFAGGSTSIDNVILSSSSDTIAGINGACGTTKTYWASSLLTLATGGTLTCPTTFSRGGVWGGTGSPTVTFAEPIKEMDAPSQHFLSTINPVLPAQTVLPAWTGGVGDGSFLANTGTDNTAAWVALIAAIPHGGTIAPQCAQYRFSGDGPKLLASGQSIVGPTNCPRVQWGDGAANSLVLFSSSPTATVVEVGGTAFGTSTVTTGNVIKNIDIGFGVTATTGIGLKTHYTYGLVVDHNDINDAATGMDITSASALASGGFTYNTVYNGYTSKTPISSGTVIQYNLHGDSTVGFTTTVGHFNQAMWNPTVSHGSATVYGHKIDGKIWDLNWDSAFGSGDDYCVYASGTTGQDVHITNLQLDHCLKKSVYLNIPGANSISITGGQNTWMTVVDSGQLAGVELDNTPNTTVSDFQCVSSLNAPCFYAHGSGPVNNVNDAFITNRCFLGIGGTALGQCVSLDTEQATVLTNNIADGNGLSGYTVPVFKFVNTIDTALTANSMSHGAGTSFSFDVNSLRNCCWDVGNSWFGWGAVSDLGTGNSYAPKPIQVTVTAATWAANTCVLQTAQSMPGVDVVPGGAGTGYTSFYITPTSDITAIVGWGSSGGLIISSWPTASTFNWKVCNQTSSSIVQGSNVVFNVVAK